MRRKRSDSEVVVTRGSGDVFADLGIELSREDRLKLEMAREITVIINRAGWTQKRVAEIIGTDQAKVSALTRGQLRGFSQERLFRFLLKLGFNVDVKISRPEKGRTGHLRVRLAA
jgi:predicted XRE-type DNA-binding protein